MMQTLVRTRRQLPGIGAAVLYGVCSTSMAFLNKAVLTSYQFDYPFTILVLQMLFTVLVLLLLKKIGTVHFPDFSLHHAKSFMLPSVCCSLNAVLGLYALGKMNIPMYGVLKRCTPVVSLVLGYFMLKKGLPSRHVIVAVLMMTIGCVVAGSGDLTFNLTAYMCGAMSNVTQALYLTLVQRHSEKRSTAETLYINSLNTLPFLLAMCFLKGEPLGVLHHPNLLALDFLLVLLAVTSLGCLLSYSMVLCTSMNSALTTTVVGMFKTIAQTSLGFVAFGGVKVTGILLVGVVMNLSGGILYAITKYRESFKSKLSLPLSSKDLMKGSNEELDKIGDDFPNYRGVNGMSHNPANGVLTMNGAYYTLGSISRERKPSGSLDDKEAEHYLGGGKVNFGTEVGTIRENGR